MTDRVKFFRCPGDTRFYCAKDAAEKHAKESGGTPIRTNRLRCYIDFESDGPNKGDCGCIYRVIPDSTADQSTTSPDEKSFLRRILRI